MTEQEVEWRPIKGYSRYMVSNTGLVMCAGYISERHNSSPFYVEPHIMQQRKCRCGYMQVMLYGDSKRKNISVHRLVAEAFLPSVDGKDFVNHIDGDKTNNNVKNLEWCTRSENMLHASKTGLVKHTEYTVKSGPFKAKLTPDQVRDIRENFHKGGSGCNSVKYFMNKYNVGDDVIYNIYNGKTYKNVV